MQPRQSNSNDPEAGWREMLARDPNNPDLWLKLADSFEQSRRWEQASFAYRSLLHLQPQNQQALSHLGYCLRHQQQWTEAEKILRQAIVLRSGDAEALHDLGAVLLAQERADEAVATLQASIRARPDYADAYCTLAAALCSAGRAEPAAAAARRALQLRPSFADARCNLALAHVEQGNLDSALQEYRQAQQETPGFAPAAWGTVWTLLAMGDYRQAWQIFETRHRLGSGFYHHPIDKALWNGEPLNGRSILLHPEKGNGYGEVIQMARFAPLVAARGGKVILECQPPLQKLMETLPGVEQIVTLGQPLPSYDLHCPLMSLAARFDVTPQNIPAEPYLTADPAMVEQWRQVANRADGRLKVGLVWSGRSQPPHRSIDPRLLTPLSRAPHVQFFSLQRQEENGPYAQLRPDFPMIDCASKLHDFSDTAALLMNLDLLISIDTAAIHLAGALGRPAWLLVRFAADWRWMTPGPVSPWYPSVRIFRQTWRGDWTGPVAEAAEQLMQTTV